MGGQFHSQQECALQGRQKPFCRLSSVKLREPQSCSLSLKPRFKTLDPFKDTYKLESLPRGLFSFVSQIV